jgi:hypothetical protein
MKFPKISNKKYFFQEKENGIIEGLSPLDFGCCLQYILNSLLKQHIIIALPGCIDIIVIEKSA